LRRYLVTDSCVNRRDHPRLAVPVRPHDVADQGRLRTRVRSVGFIAAQD
jgi:hypothetical protein